MKGPEDMTRCRRANILGEENTHWLEDQWAERGEREAGLHQAPIAIAKDGAVHCNELPPEPSAGVGASRGLEESLNQQMVSGETAILAAHPTL
jgi:hypothetical protein